jgi:periplasmic divalent cation tolerance protein
MDDCLQVTTTVDSRAKADELATLAVERRLAACAQVVGPIESTYWWNSAVETASEWQVLFKTTAARVEALIATVGAEHPYQTPEIIATPIVAGHPGYLDWLRAETETS